MTGRRGYRLASNAIRRGDRLLGGSPMRLFVLGDRGRRLVDRIAAGDPVDATPLVRRLVETGVLHPLASAAGDERRTEVTVVTPTLGTPAFSAPGAVVVDDGSRSPVPGATVRLPANRGPAAARNAGLCEVSTQFVAFVDADVELPPGWLGPLLGHFDDPRVAAVAPRVRSRPGPSRRERYERRSSPLDLGPEPAVVARSGLVTYVPSAALVARTDVVRSIGGFDPRLRFGEDVDLVWRLLDAGHVVRYEPASVVTHLPRPSWRAWARQRVAYGGSAADLARRHPTRIAPWRGRPASLLPWSVLGRGVVPTAGTALAPLAWQTAWISHRTGLDLPTSARLAAGGAWAGLVGTARAVRRAWWPLIAVASVRSRGARRALVAGAVLAGGPIRLVDDLAYSAGVWLGMARARTAGPIVPEVVAGGRSTHSGHPRTTA